MKLNHETIDESKKVIWLGDQQTLAPGLNPGPVFVVYLLRMIFIFTYIWKSKQTYLYVKIDELQFCCPEIKCIGTLPYSFISCIVCDYFHTPIAESSNCNKEPMTHSTENISYLTLYRKVC